MLFKNGVKNIQVAGYNGERTAYDFLPTTYSRFSQKNAYQAVKFII